MNPLIVGIFGVGGGFELGIFQFCELRFIFLGYFFVLASKGFDLAVEFVHQFAEAFVLSK